MPSAALPELMAGTRSCAVFELVQTTRIALPPEQDASDLRVLSLPSALSYSPPEAEPIRFCCIGEKALERRDHLRLVHPLRTEN